MSEVTCSRLSVTLAVFLGGGSHLEQQDLIPVATDQESCCDLIKSNTFDDKMKDFVVKWAFDDTMKDFVVKCIQVFTTDFPTTSTRIVERHGSWHPVPTYISILTKLGDYHSLSI